MTERQARSGGGRWWFRVRVTPGQAGAELISRIPGTKEIITWHATEADADAAAATAYGEYTAAVEAARDQEAS